jgi:hypothetical protein
MALGFTTAEKNRILDLASPGWGFASLHTADPSTTGANEVTGGTPAYARKALTMGAASGGQTVTITTAQAFDVPAGTSVRFVGIFSAVTAGTFRGSLPADSALANPLVFTALASTDVLTVPGHAFVNGDEVVVIDTDGSTLPTGLSEATVYFVVGVSGNTLQLSATSGGSAINLTADGAGHITSMTTETFGGQGVYNIAIGAFSVSLLAVT